MPSFSVYLSDSETADLGRILAREKLADTVPALLQELARQTIREYAPKGGRKA